MKKMNLPNKLTVFRICLVPVILLFGMLTPQSDGSLWFYISSGICAVIFVIAAITDMLDGKIARRDNHVTDFGKFLDPVADKFMVIGAMFVLLYKFPNLNLIMTITLIVVVFRELAVTAIRMVVAGDNVVVAANMLGKIKTVSQIVMVMAALLEPVLAKISFLFFLGYYPITVIASALTLVMTVWSGIVYVKTYWKYMDKNM